MIDWKFRTIIVPDTVVSTIRQLTDAFGPGAANMFTTPLSATGSLPATHWISSGYIDAPFAAALPLTEWFTDEEGNTTSIKTDGDYDAFVTLCEAFEVTPVDINTYAALASAVIVSIEEPQQTLSRLNLQLISEE